MLYGKFPIHPVILNETALRNKTTYNDSFWNRSTYFRYKQILVLKQLSSCIHFNLSNISNMITCIIFKIEMIY